MRRARLAVAVAAVMVAVPGCRRSAEERPAEVVRQDSPATGASAPAPSTSAPTASPSQPDPTSWSVAVAKVEEVRGGGAPVPVPAELRHASDRREFLAVQLADSQLRNYDLPHDIGELADMIAKGELVELPRLGDHHILYEVGEDAREDPLAHYDTATNKDVPLVGSEEELQTLLASTPAAKKSLIEQVYARNRDELFREHQAVTALARNFGGLSYDLADPQQSREFQRRLLSFLRPAARDIVVDIARGYHAQFDRPLPVTSIIRTQRYQRRLSRVNPNATKVDAPPHTTGMAFDISYKFMPPAEQNWVMAEVARLEREGRVEALRERRNHLHVYTFGASRPGDAVVAQYLDDVGAARPVRVAKASPRRTAAAKPRAAARKTRRAR
jgi:hypothetical protein